jgi:hypothetical protein
VTFTKTAAAVPLHDKTFSRMHRTVEVVGPASYTTNGDPVPLADLALVSIHAWLGGVFCNGTVAILAWYDQAANKLKFFDMAGAEIANGVDLSLYKAHVLIVGKG